MVTLTGSRSLPASRLRRLNPKLAAARADAGLADASLPTT